MKLLQFSEARNNLSKVFDQIENDAEETVITRSGHDPMVVLPLHWYNSMRETLYLLEGANGRVLTERIADMEAGGGEPHDLLDVEDVGEA
jgi:antitoxin YefM